AALADGLQRSDPTERHAALAVLPRVKKDTLSRVSREAYAAALSMGQHAPAVVGEVLGRLAIVERSSDILSKFFGLSGVTTQITERVLDDLIRHGSLTEGEWQAILRYLPRAPRRVGALILQNIASDSARRERREILRSAIGVVADDNNTAGAIA